jgi:hypothetical protein
VLPPPFERVPAEQILDPARRPRRLFAGEPLELGSQAQGVLARSLADLDEPVELQELGAGLYLDRPLGIFKRPGEPDRTPLLSYVAFSRTLAARRLRELQELGAIGTDRCGTLAERLKNLQVRGINLEPQAMRPRPGVASLLDACQLAGDFQLLRTTPRSLADFLAVCDLAPLLADFTPRLIVGGPVLKEGLADSLAVFDDGLRPRLVFRFEPVMTCRAGREFPAGGLKLVWRDGLDLSGPVIHSKPGKVG